MAEHMNGEQRGLGDQPKRDWPTVTSLEGDKPIDRLKPTSKEHQLVLDYLLDRIRLSQREMRKFYSRWRINERKYQAFISLPDWEQLLKDMNDEGKPPKIVSITIPYTFATISTIVTFLIHTFAGRKPMFQLGTHKSETARNARMMETVLQYNSDHTRMIKHLFQMFHDGQVYGVGIMRDMWSREEQIRTVWMPRDKTAGGDAEGPAVKKREKAVTYEGNIITSIDPYNFLPDPRVPMSEVSRSGEFVFWKSFEGRHALKKLEAQGKVKWVDAGGIGDSGRNIIGGGEEFSNRSLISGGSDQPGDRTTLEQVQRFTEIHQGTVEIIPAELGLGESEIPEKWLFTILNQKQIIQAEPLALDHDRHPVVVTEPYTMGYSFGQPGMSDYLNQIQDGLSWLINSHMDNVRTALNNMFVVDPSKIEIQDLKEPGAGKLIRLKKSAYGQDVKGALQQLDVKDVTRNHIQDFQLFMSLGDAMSSITDNLRGLQAAGGRKTATEVRTAGEAGASRLAAQSRLISAQALVDLTEMMVLNLQQNLSDEFFLQIVGQDGVDNSHRITPEHITGDFHYPVHDGTLPLDRVALLDIWREILAGVSADPVLSQAYSLPKLFEFVADLGGAKNIKEFRIEGKSDEDIQQQVQAGNLIPAQAGQTPGIGGSPADRARV